MWCATEMKLGDTVVLRSVIKKNMTGHEVNDLLEVTFANGMALQANLISKYQIANEIVNESNSLVQVNGVKKFFTFDISTHERSFTGSILDLDIENSKTQLEVTKSMFSELSEIFNGLSGNPDEINCILSKMVKTIHNTMSDRGPTNKPYIHLFQEWRESLLRQQYIMGMQLMKIQKRQLLKSTTFTFTVVYIY